MLAKPQVRIRRFDRRHRLPPRLPHRTDTNAGGVTEDRFMAELALFESLKNPIDCVLLWWFRTVALVARGR